MDLIFLIQEAFDGLKRTKYASLITVSTIGICLVLVGTYFVVSKKSDDFLEELKSKISLQVFLQNTVTESQIPNLTQKIKRIEGVAEVNFTSKKDAIEKLSNEMKTDLISIAGYNPLQDEFTVLLLPNFSDENSIKKIKINLQNLEGVETIEFNNSLIVQIGKFQENYKKINLMIGILIGIFAVILITNTVRLSIAARSKTIEIMKLIGATNLFIRIPFLLEGIIQGLLGSLLSILAVFFAAKFIGDNFNFDFSVSRQTYLTLVFLGISLGFIGSLIAVEKFLGAKKNKS
ncbi:hypothetical protein IT568_01405 [bacterium]|nr:hypothetical protein [bacterium]